MPSLEVLDALKQHINALGDEPRLLAARGEKLEDIAPPESSGPPNLEEVLARESDGIDEMDALLSSHADDFDLLDDLPDFSDLSDDGETVNLEASSELDDWAETEEGSDISDIEDTLAFLDAEEAVEAAEAEETAVVAETLEAVDVGEDVEPAGLAEAAEPEELAGFEFPIDEPGDIEETLAFEEDAEVFEDLPAFEEASEPAETAGPESIEEAESIEEPAEAPGVLDTLDLGMDFESEIPEAEIPDVEAAVAGLDTAVGAAGEEQGLDELSLDTDELNFEEELGADVLSDIREVEEESSQFSMDDFGDQYNFTEGESGIAETLGEDLNELEQSLDEAPEDEEKPFGLEDEDLSDILATLSTLPRNLKIAIEELLADEKQEPEKLKPLIEGLINGNSPKALAGQYKAITKRTIELPRSYKKQSGKALEKKRAALFSQLSREGWPVLRLILVVITVVWVVSAVSFMWVYRPLKAASLYRRGLEYAMADNAGAARELFFDAWYGWPLFPANTNAPVVVKGWEEKRQWLDYARAFRQRKHWDDAVEFYSGYLEIRPEAKNVRLEYVKFLSAVLARYEEAVQVLREAPQNSRKAVDRDYTLAAGDVYFRWAEDDPAKYEDARYHYAKVLETSRNDERAMLSMMRYHLRLQNHEEVQLLLPVFAREVPGKTREPELAAEVFAELGEWFLKRGNTEEARRFINLALAAFPSVAYPHYVNALYFRLTGTHPEAEMEAYTRTLVALDNMESMDRRDLQMRILSLGGMGRLQFRQYLQGRASSGVSEGRVRAMKFYEKAISLYEDAKSRKLLGAAPQYGALYRAMGDILFLGADNSGDLVFTLADKPELLAPGSERRQELLQAEGYYTRAGETGLTDQALYRRGYIRYLLGRDGVLVDFYRVARQQPRNYDAQLALAMVLLDNGDYEAAQNRYARALELLDGELIKTGGILDTEERPGHGELLLRYIVAWNNLGVGRALSAARGGGRGDYGEALSAFTMASEYQDMVNASVNGLMERGAPALRDSDLTRIREDLKMVDRMDYREKLTYPYRNRLRVLGLEKAPGGEQRYLIYRDIPSDITAAAAAGQAR